MIAAASTHATPGAASTHPTLRGSAAHFFVADVASPALDDADLHHARTVLRLGADETVTVCDGAGAWRPCTMRRDGTLAPGGDVAHEPAPRWPLLVAFAPVKGERPEWTVQKLVELGIDAIVPLAATARAVVRWDGERGGRHLERLRRVAREAAMQSRRTRLPVVHDAMPLATLGTAAGPLASLGTAAGPLAIADPSGAPLDATHRAVAIGPEGGFTDDEMGDAPRVALADGILRAETAALAAATLMTHLRRTSP
ncbi:MAG: RsmE family RNA methyltransferase [Ilumatobacteraceae bacterium]